MNEVFFNDSGRDCHVLKRDGERTLIYMPTNQFTPFVVPLIHKQGETLWYHGIYCHTLDEALREYDKRTN